MNTTETKKAIFPAVKDGETFKIAGMEFIKFPEVDGKVPAVMKNIAFRSEFGDNNDLRTSTVLKKMEKDILLEIVGDVGEENICAVHTDLTTLCGLKTYGVMESRISLPTLDFYRANVEIFDKYLASSWWWLATPESGKPHDNPYWTLCVSPAGGIGGDDCNRSIGVRPFCIFKSSIFESFEE